MALLSITRWVVELTDNTHNMDTTNVAFFPPINLHFFTLPRMTKGQQ